MHVKLVENASRPDTDWSWQTSKYISSTVFKIHPYSRMSQSVKTWPLNNVRKSYRIQFTLTFTKLHKQNWSGEKKKALNDLWWTERFSFHIVLYYLTKKKEEVGVP